MYIYIYIYIYMYVCSVGYQLIGQKTTQVFHQLKYLMERPVALIQQVDSVEQWSD